MSFLRSTSPLLLNTQGKPYTNVDRLQFLRLLAQKGFANAAHPAKGWAGGGQTSVASKGGTQKSLDEVLRQKMNLKADIERSYAEHERAGENGLGGGTQAGLFELARYVAFTSDTIFVPGPIKTLESMWRKLMDYETVYQVDKASRLMGHTMDYSHLGKDHPKNKKLDAGYAGDYSKVKDEVRCTLVALDEQKYAIACSTMRSIVLQAATFGLSFVKQVTRDPDQDPCGYSDTNMVLQLQNREPGEVQINIKPVLFGKMAKQDFCKTLGVSDADYYMMGVRSGLDGGMGHALYEIYRTNKANPRGKLAAKLSKQYYALLRGSPNADARDPKKLSAELARFRSAPENRPFFAHAVTAAPPGLAKSRGIKSDYR